MRSYVKKLISLTVCIVLMLSLTACGGGSTTSTVSENTSTEPVAAESESESYIDSETAGTESEPVSAEVESESTEDTEPKRLVAYFSASGNTKAVAEVIASETGANLFELVPAEPYTADDLNWNATGSRVNNEHNDKSLQDVALVAVTPDDWDEYDIVFIGYPIWWGDAAWPVNNFITANDFTGKTVIPFCTSYSSDLGDSAENLASLAGTGDWLPGTRFPEKSDEKDIADWVSTFSTIR